MTLFKRYIAFWFFILCFYRINACQVDVFDCGQGNTVSVQYEKQIMFFDAGQKGYSKLIAHEAETSDESTGPISFEVKESKEDHRLLSTAAPVPLKSTSKDKKKFKEWFKSEVEEHITGKNLKAIFVSHPDADHYNLISEYDFFNQDKTKVLIGGNYSLYSKKFQKKFSKESCIILPKGSGDVYSPELKKNAIEFTSILGKSPKVEVLTVNASGTSRKEDKNEDSMVVKITTDKYSMLLSGDAEEKTWDSIKKDKKDPLKADVFLVSHHGSMTNGSTTKALLERIQPKACLISAGFEHHHPTLKTIKVLYDYYKQNNSFKTPFHFVTCYDKKERLSVVTNAPIFTTIDNGRLSIDLSANKLIIKSSRNFEPTPGVTLSGDESMMYFDVPSSSQKVFSYQELKQRNGGKEPAEFIDKEIFIISPVEIKKKIIEKECEDEYYYKYGQKKPLYFQVERILEEFSEDSDDSLDTSDLSSSEEDD